MAQIALFLVAAVLGTAIHGYEIPSPHYKKASKVVSQTNDEETNHYPFIIDGLDSPKQEPPVRQWPPPYVPPMLKQDQGQDSFPQFESAGFAPSAIKQDSSSHYGQMFTTEEPRLVPSRDSSKYHCYRDGLFLNPFDCTTYIQCSNMRAYIRVCPAGLHFNRRTQQCDQPCNARCDPRACRQTPHSARSTDFVCYKDGLNRNPEDCSSYIQCSNGWSYVMPCVRGLHYNVETQRCEAPCYAHCDASMADECGWTDEDTTSVEYEEYKSKKSSLPAGFTCIEDGLFLNPKNCSTYIRCFDGQATIMQCPGNLHFSQQNLRCEAPCDAHCDESVAEDCGWDLWQYNILKEDFTCDKDGLFKNPDDCSTYTQCSSGQGYVMPCPKGLHFSEESQSCETPCEARCDPSLAEKCGSNTDGSMLKQPIFDFSCIRNGLYENHADCGSFIQCTGGSAYLVSCPLGQHFDHRTKKCEEPCTAQCDPNIDSQCREDKSIKRRPWPIHWNSAKQSSDFTCYEDGLFPDPQDCSRYIRCINGRSRTVTCPGDRHYSQATRKCESPCDARCDASLADVCGWAYKVKAQRQPNYDSVCNRDGTFQNPSNCSSYIQCSDKQANIVSCPEGLHFSAETQSCEVPCYAHCDQTLAEFCGWDNSPEDGSPAYVVGQPAREGEYSILAQFNETRKPSVLLQTGGKGLTLPSTNHVLSNENSLMSTPNPSLILEDFDCQRDGFYDSGECTTYVMCLNEVAYLLPCPRGLHFNQEAQKCMAPHEARCKHNIAPVTQEGIECDAEPDAGPCFGNQPRYYYDANSGQCRRFIYGGCGGNTNRFETESECKETCQRRLLREGMPCINATGRFGHLDCRKFYECKRGTLTVMRCPIGKAFDHIQSKCVPEAEVACLYKCRERNGVDPFPLDCNHYINCANGLPKVEECPLDLRFDPKISNCVEAWKVPYCYHQI